MSDLLTHVLAAYAVSSVLAWRLAAVESRHVPVAMVGALLPDAAKVYLLLGGPTSTVGSVSLSWYALQTVGAVASLVAAGALLFAPGERRRALGLLSLGAVIHVALDLLVIRADGLAPPYFYPLTWWHPPAGDLYLSSDVWPSLLTGCLAVAVFAVNRRRSR